MTATNTTPPVTGCEDPALASQFHPSLDVKPAAGRPGPAGRPARRAWRSTSTSRRPTTRPTSAPSSTPRLPQAPEPKDVTVKLPAGLSISPLLGRRPGRLLGSAPRTRPATRSTTTTPNRSPVPIASKIGTATVDTPLLASRDPVDDKVTGPEPIPGDIYLIKPHPGDLSPSGNRTAPSAS